MCKQRESESKRERLIKKTRFGYLCSHKIQLDYKGSIYEVVRCKEPQKENEYCIVCEKNELISKPYK